MLNYQQFVNESNNRVNVQFFTRNAREFLDGITPTAETGEFFSQEEWEVLDFVVDRIKQTHPDGDITKLDLVKTLDHFDAPDVDQETAEELIDIVWGEIVN